MRLWILGATLILLAVGGLFVAQPELIARPTAYTPPELKLSTYTVSNEYVASPEDTQSEHEWPKKEWGAFAFEGFLIPIPPGYSPRDSCKHGGACSLHIEKYKDGFRVDDQLSLEVYTSPYVGGLAEFEEYEVRTKNFSSTTATHNVVRYDTLSTYDGKVYTNTIFAYLCDGSSPIATITRYEDARDTQKIMQEFLTRLKPESETTCVHLHPQYLGGRYSKDATHVYYSDYSGYTALVGAEPRTFTVLSAKRGAEMGRDETSVWYGSSRIEGADSGTFTLLPVSPYVPSYYGNQVTFARDANHVFVLSPNLNSDAWKETEVVSRYFQLIPGADPDTFEVLSSEVGKDSRGVYINTQLIPGADPKTFTVLPYPGVDGWVAYGKDAAHVYYLSIVATEIAGADPATFTVSEKGAFDKNHRFLHEMIWDKP